jgi:hypothetical protein
MFRAGSIHGRICKRFPVGRRPPSQGIDLYHFRRNDVTVLTFSLVSRSGVPSSLALRPRYSVSGFHRAPVFRFSAFHKLLLELLG